MASARKTEWISISLFLATLLLLVPPGCREETSCTNSQSNQAATVLTLGSGTEIKNPNDEQIRNALESFNVERDSEGFAILARSQMTYVQVSGDSDIGFDLEYQDGNINAHYRAKRVNYTLDEVVKVLIAYRDGNIRWNEVGNFERITW